MTTLTPRTPSGAPRGAPRNAGVTGRTARVPAVAFLVVAVVVVVVVVGTPAILGVALLVGLGAAIVDVRTRRLPDALVALGGVPTLAGAAAAAVQGSPTVAPGAAIGALGFGGPLLVAHLATPSGIGFGDVKLAGVLGAAIGVVDPRLGILALCIAAGLTASVGVLRQATTLPFGPGLVVGAAGALGSPWGFG